MTRAVEILERHPVDLLGDILAEAVCNIDGHIGHDPALDIGEHGRKQIQQQHLDDDVADMGEINRASAGDLGHHPCEQYGGGIPQDLGAKNGGHGGTDGKNPYQDDQGLVTAKVFDQFDECALEVARFFSAQHRHGAAAPHRHHRPSSTSGLLLAAGALRV